MRNQAQAQNECKQLNPSYVPVQRVRDLQDVLHDATCRDLNTGKIFNVSNPNVPAVTFSNQRAGIVQTGLLAEYNFSEGTGLLFTDLTGHGNTATAISGGTWLAGGGWSCNGTSTYATLPSSLTSAVRSIVIFQKFGPIPSGGMPSSLFPMPVANTNLAGISLKEGYQVTDGASASAAKANGSPALYQNSVTQVGTYETAIGFHMITANFTGQSIYVDDTIAASYYKNAALSVPSVGQFSFCGHPTQTSNSFFKGNLYYAAFYDHVLTSQEVTQNYQAVKSYLLLRGVNMSPARGSWGAANRFVAIGDSITENNYVQYMTGLTSPNTNSWALTNDGVSGHWVLDAIANGPLRDDILIMNNGMLNICLIFIGTNDINGGRPFNDVAAFLSSLIQQRKKAGWKVIVGTMLSRTGFDATKNNYNAFIRDNWFNMGADWLVDFASDPNLGCDGCSTNTTYFQDGVHPTLGVGGGEQILGLMASDALNSLIGHRSFSSAITTTAATYTQLTSDVYLNVNPSANSVVVTLLSARGFTNDPPRCIRNIQRTGTNTVTINKASVDGGFDNNGSLTSVAIPNATTVCMTGKLSSSTSPQSYWSFTQ